MSVNKMTLDEAIEQAVEKGIVVTATSDATQRAMTHVIDIATLHSISAETHIGTYISIFEAINQITK